MSTELANDKIRNAVRETYAKIANSSEGSCSSSNICCPGGDAKATSKELGYSDADVDDVPDGANMGLGCGNPRAIASLRPGETVLDLGSGGGFDAFLAAKEIGDMGKVIGVDMTPDMVSKARENAVTAGRANVEFRLGEIENLPVADDAVDVIISNCVINLSPDKAQVFREAYRVLKPGGRLAVSDIVASADLPEQLKNDMALFTGCMAGASLITDVESMLEDAGFERIEVKPKAGSREFIRKWTPGTKIEDYVVSAYIEAVKPTP
ncbi:MAG: arsenite methyltransferase [Deltaproteobacteria bacterium]|nr:arsenite methyltransferase [Deltaproteobacteria bacterium]